MNKRWLGTSWKLTKKHVLYLIQEMEKRIKFFQAQWEMYNLIGTQFELLLFCVLFYNLSILFYSQTSRINLFRVFHKQQNKLPKHVCRKNGKDCLWLVNVGMCMRWVEEEVKQKPRILSLVTCDSLFSTSMTIKFKF